MCTSSLSSPACLLSGVHVIPDLVQHDLQALTFTLLDSQIAKQAQKSKSKHCVSHEECSGLF